MVRSKKAKAHGASDDLQPATATRPAPIVAATVDYEGWLHTHIPVVQPDIRLKHEQMADSLFAFLRATFYRWASLWSEVCPDLVKTPRVLAVGDQGSRPRRFGARTKCPWPYPGVTVLAAAECA